MAGENPIESGEKKVEHLIKSEPWYVWAGAAAAAGVVFYFVWKRRQSAGSSTASPAASGTSGADAINGYAVDSLAGLPYGYEAGGYGVSGGPVDNYPMPEVGVNGNNYPIIPFGETPIYDSNGNLVAFQQPNPNPQSPAPGPGPAPGSQTGTIRNVQGGQTAGYDKSNPGGVPFRSTPGGTVLSEVPYGSSVTITGAPVQGPSNFGADPGHTGSLLWFPVTINGSKGYISAYDVINVVGSGGGGIPEDMAGFHVAVNQGRNTIDQWTFSNGMHQDFSAYAGAAE